MFLLFTDFRGLWSDELSCKLRLMQLLKMEVGDWMSLSWTWTLFLFIIGSHSQFSNYEEQSIPLSLRLTGSINFPNTLLVLRYEMSLLCRKSATYYKSELIIQNISLEILSFVAEAVVVSAYMYIPSWMLKLPFYKKV